MPTAAQRLRARVREQQAQRGGVVEKVQRAAKEVEKTANKATPDSASTPRVTKVEVVQPTISLSNLIWSSGTTAVNVLGQFVVVLFLVYFFLVTGHCTSGSS